MRIVQNWQCYNGTALYEQKTHHPIWSHSPLKRNNHVSLPMHSTWARRSRDRKMETLVWWYIAPHCFAFINKFEFFIKLTSGYPGERNMLTIIHNKKQETYKWPAQADVKMATCLRNCSSQNLKINVLELHNKWPQSFKTIYQILSWWICSFLLKRCRQTLHMMTLYHDGATLVVWEWISNFTPHFPEHVIIIHAGIKVNPC